MDLKKCPFVYYSKTIIGVKTKQLRRRHLPTLDYDQFQQMKAMPFCMSEDGKVFVNINDKGNIAFVQYFLAMAESSTTSLMDVLEGAKDLYPDVVNPEDILNYQGVDQEKAAFKIMIPYELERRKRELSSYENK